MNPIVLLRESIKQVPSMKYALAVAGIFSAVAIVASFGLDFRVAIVGSIVTLILMIVILIFARVSAAQSRTLAVPAKVITWFSLLLFMATSTVLFTSVFFKYPLDLGHWIDSQNLTEIHEKSPNFKSWHAKTSQFKSEILLNDLAENDLLKNRYNLLIICMKRDDAISYRLNEKIEKSNLYPIGKESVMPVTVNFSKSFSDSLDENDIIQGFLCLLNKKHSLNDFKTLSELEKIDGVIYHNVYESIK